MADAPPITVYWRPACPFCMVLRRGLKKLGLPTQEIDIWSDPEGAAAVRAAANGNETVPTVRVGDTWMVNPSSAEVLQAAAAIGVTVQR